ncbi:divisome protein SepX/GlpR [Pseudonocardia phyllosphaerae]|uniref:divisome protein SepX/GlpR n=1 Tax=Pseudonocardia phyllosphaerae TaxID=3390502 RepID=UPI00397E820E
MPSSVFFVGLVVLWLLFLVPTVARRQQEVARLSPALLSGRVLERPMRHRYPEVGVMDRSGPTTVGELVEARDDVPGDDRFEAEAAHGAVPAEREPGGSAGGDRLAREHREHADLDAELDAELDASHHDEHDEYEHEYARPVRIARDGSASSGIASSGAVPLTRDHGDAATGSEPADHEPVEHERAGHDMHEPDHDTFEPAEAHEPHRELDDASGSADDADDGDRAPVAHDEFGDVPETDLHDEDLHGDGLGRETADHGDLDDVDREDVDHEDLDHESPDHEALDHDAEHGAVPVDPAEPPAARYRPGRGGFDPQAAAETAHAKYAFRQRVVLALLVLLLAGVLTALLVSTVFWWVAAAVGLGLAGYLTYLRRQVRIEETIRARRTARLAGPPRDHDADDTAAVRADLAEHDAHHDLADDEIDAEHDEPAGDRMDKADAHDPHDPHDTAADDDWTADDADGRVRGTGEPLGVLPARRRTVDGPASTEHESSLPRLAAAPPPPVPAGTSMVDLESEESVEEGMDQLEPVHAHRPAVGE